MLKRLAMAVTPEIDTIVLAVVSASVALPVVAGLLYFFASQCQRLN